MNIFKAYIMALALCGASAFQLSAAKPVKEVKGTYEYFIPRHISRDQAEQIALERAMIEALAREFGTSVSMNTHMDMRSSRNGESQDFYSAASSIVKGEWVETIDRPKFALRIDGDDIVITCEVKGRAREINRAQADLDVRILRNTTGEMTEAASFLDGDKLYMSFASPVAGYLTVYLEGEDKMVYRMLPFYAEKITATPIEADTKYTFFVSTEGDAEQYVMTAERGTEHNTIYVVFSPNEYIKPIDRSGDEDLSLRELSVNDFRKWLQKAQGLDEQLQVLAKPITVTRRIED